MNKNNELSYTIITADEMPHVGKSFTLNDDGTLGSTTAVAVSSGQAERIDFSSEERDKPCTTLSHDLDELAPNEFIVIGVNEKEVVTIGAGDTASVRRTKQEFPFSASGGGWVCLDCDASGSGLIGTERAPQSRTELLEMLERLMPGITKSCLVRSSSSAGVCSKSLGELRPDHGRWHVFVPLARGTDAALIIDALYHRAIAEGIYWGLISRNGHVHVKTIVDRALMTSCQPIFCSEPKLSGDLYREVEPPVVRDGGLFKSSPDAFSFDDKTHQALEDLRERFASEIADARGRYLSEFGKRRGLDDVGAQALINEISKTRRLDGDWPLTLDDGRVVAAEELALSPAIYDGVTLSDPVEGISYGRGKAKFFANRGEAGREPCIVSLAHGVTSVYTLGISLAEIRERLRRGVEDVVPLIASLPKVGDSRDKAISDLSREQHRTVSSINRQIREAEKARADSAAEAESERVHAEFSALAEATGRVLLKYEHHRCAEIADEVLRELGAREQLFNLGGSMAVKDAVDGRAMFIRPNISTLARHCEAAFVLHQKGKRIGVPHTLKTALVGRQQLAGCELLPVCHGVTDSPVLRPCGALVASEGFDAESGWFLSGRAEVEGLSVPEVVSEEQAREAWRWLCRELFGEFYFAQGVGVAGGRDLLASGLLLLTAVGRGLCRGAPMGVVVSAGPGSGKSALCAAILAAAYGGGIPSSSLGRGEEELDKVLSCLARSGSSCWFFNNVSNGLTINSARLADVCTFESPVGFRILGESAVVTLTRGPYILLNGNGISVAEDLNSRVLKVRLDPPENAGSSGRVFKRDVIAWARRERAAVLSACITILRGWIQAKASGVSVSAFSTGSRLGEWDSAVGAALAWASGEVSQIRDLVRVASAEDQRHQSMAGFLEALENLGGDAGLSARDICAHYRRAVMSGGAVSGALADAMEDLWPRDPEKPTRLARHLRGLEGYKAGGRVLVRTSKDRRERFVSVPVAKAVRVCVGDG